LCFIIDNELLFLSSGDSVILIDPGISENHISQSTLALFSVKPTYQEKSTSWEVLPYNDEKRLCKLVFSKVINHFNTQTVLDLIHLSSQFPKLFGIARAITLLQYHRRVCIEHFSFFNLKSFLAGTGSSSVLIHQLSKKQSQSPFSKSPGLVQSIVFHPLKPYLLVAVSTFQCIKIVLLICFFGRRNDSFEFMI
jgi:hypothetical protein